MYDGFYCQFCSLLSFFIITLASFERIKSSIREAFMIYLYRKNRLFACMQDVNSCFMKCELNHRFFFMKIKEYFYFITKGLNYFYFLAIFCM